MTTRNDIQVTQDLVRFVNIMNDLLDCASYTLKEIDPETGDRFQIREGVGGEIYRDATLEELKLTARQSGQNALAYRNTLQSFIIKYGGENIRKALLSLNVNYDDILSDITTMENEARNLVNNVKFCETKAELISMAKQIDQNVPKLVLVRRSWCLGV